MTRTLAVDPDARRGVVTLRGPVHGADLVEACQLLTAAPGWDPTFDEVWDLSEAGVGIDPDALQRIVDAVTGEPAAYGPCRVAVVTTSPEVATIVDLLDRRARPHGRPYVVFPTLEAAFGALDGSGPAGGDAPCDREPID